MDKDLNGEVRREINMWTHVKPYFYFYLAGCICYALLLLIKMIILHFPLMKVLSWKY